MYSVLSVGGAITGYVVGSYYLSLDMARFYFDTLDGCKSVYGGRHGVFFVSNVTGEAVPVENVSLMNFDKFNEACNEDGAKLHDMLFVPCNYNDFDLYKTNGIWMVRGLYCYQCRYRGVVVGYIALDRPLFGSKSVMLAMIEALNRREGFGTRIVNELKSRGIKISGISTVEAMSFWKSHGAVFSDWNRFNI